MPTGGLFPDWWESQDVVGRNVWLRQMGVRLTFTPDGVALDLGNVSELVERLVASGNAAAALTVFEQMAVDGVAGVQLSGDSVSVVPVEREP